MVVIYHPPIHPPIHPPTDPPIHPPIHLPIYPSTHQPTHISTHPSTHPPIHPANPPTHPIPRWLTRVRMPMRFIWLPCHADTHTAPSPLPRTLVIAPYATSPNDQTSLNAWLSQTSRSSGPFRLPCLTGIDESCRDRVQHRIASTNQHLISMHAWDPSPNVEHTQAHGVCTATRSRKLLANIT